MNTAEQTPTTIIADLKKRQEKAPDEYKWFFEPVSPLSTSIVPLNRKIYIGNTGIMLAKPLPLTLDFLGDAARNLDKPLELYFDPFREPEATEDKISEKVNLFVGGVLALARWNSEQEADQQIKSLVGTTGNKMHEFMRRVFSKLGIYAANIMPSKEKFAFTINLDKLTKQIQGETPETEEILELEKFRFERMLKDESKKYPSPLMPLKS